MIVRPPCAALRPFIETLWATNGSSQLANAHQLVLPTGNAHIVLRLDHSPVRIQDGPTMSSVIGGVRSTSYYKETVAGAATVGMILKPGAPELISGTPASAFTNKHVELESVWGHAILSEVIERLCQTHSALLRLEIIEETLTQRLPTIRGIHPAVAHALTRINTQTKIRDIVAETKLSHRHFTNIFNDTVGLTPKRFRDIKRFNQVLELQKKSPNFSWAAIAAETGFADQAHLVRDFVAHANITPTQYRQLAQGSTHHLPV